MNIIFLISTVNNEGKKGVPSMLLGLNIPKNSHI